MKYYFSLFIILIFFTSRSVAQQDVTGLWTGELYVDSTKQHLPYEIAVSENKGKLTGYSRIVFYEDGREESGFENITLRWEGKKVIINDEGFFEHNFSSKPSKRVKKEMTLTLTTTDSTLTLQGNWQTNKTRFYLVATGSTLLKRKKDFKTTELYKKLDSLNLTAKLSFTQPVNTVAVATKGNNNDQVVALASNQEAFPLGEPDSAIVVSPAVERLNHLALLPVSGKPQPSRLKVDPLSKQKKALYASLTRYTLPIKPKEAELTIVEKKPVPPPVTVKPAPAAKPVVAKPEAVAVAKTETPVVAVAKPQPAPVLELPSEKNGAAEIEKRAVASIQSVYYESDSLILSLYDNGEVDGDTVTVVMNGKVIFSRTGLTTKANNKTIYTNDASTDSIYLVMYAENLGEIPPNTGLLVVRDGENTYDVRFSADLQNNAAIILKRKKKP